MNTILHQEQIKISAERRNWICYIMSSKKEVFFFEKWRLENLTKHHLFTVCVLWISSHSITQELAGNAEPQPLSRPTKQALWFNKVPRWFSQGSVSPCFWKEHSCEPQSVKGAGLALSQPWRIQWVRPLDDVSFWPCGNCLIQGSPLFWNVHM